MARRRQQKHAGAWVGLAVMIGLGLAGGTQTGKHHHLGFGLPHLAAASASTDPGGNVALGQRLAARYYGWTGAQWGCLDTLWERESGWDQYNTYPSHDTPPSVPGSSITTAYGIPQALPAQKMAAAGPGWQTNPRTQIRWGLGYVARTYGNPCTALNFETANAGY